MPAIPDDLDAMWEASKNDHNTFVGSEIRMLIGRVGRAEADIATLRDKLQPASQETAVPLKPRCFECNKVGMSHCAHPEECGNVYYPASHVAKLAAENATLRDQLAGARTALKRFVDAYQPGDEYDFMYESAIRALAAPKEGEK